MELGENQATGRLEAAHSMNISRYLHIPPAKGEALPGQPAIQVGSRSPSSLWALARDQLTLIIALFPSLVSRVIQAILRGGLQVRWLGGASFHSWAK